MIAYVSGQKRNGLLVPFGVKVEEYHRQNSFEKCRKSVKCLDDGKEFLSMSEASRYYQISLTAINNSIKYNRPALSRKQNKTYSFSKI